nr:MAG TPA: hypothetical protein [Caudoviricetes sp.]DAN34200.1 MAG TPA: hypothetical protein [Caudoviricetes sp.]
MGNTIGRHRCCHRLVCQQKGQQRQKCQDSA